MINENILINTLVKSKNDLCGCNQDVIDKVIELIKMKPKLDEWISVEERLPDDENEYLVTDGYDMMVAFYRDDAEAWDNGNFGWVERNSDDDCPCRLGKVIAWKPLPEPYKKRRVMNNEI